MALPRPRIPENQNVLFPVQKAAVQQRPELSGRFRRQPLEIESLQRLLQRQRRVFQQPLHPAAEEQGAAAAPSLSATAAPCSSAAARIPARSLPADTAHSSASLVLPAAPCLRSTPAPSAGANP